MARVCELTGKNPMSGNNVSLMSEAMGLTYRFRISANALKSVEHRGGLDAFLAKASKDELSDKARKLKASISKKLEGRVAA